MTAILASSIKLTVCFQKLISAFPLQRAIRKCNTNQKSEDWTTTSQNEHYNWLTRNSGKLRNVKSNWQTYGLYFRVAVRRSLFRYGCVASSIIFVCHVEFRWIYLVVYGSFPDGCGFFWVSNLFQVFDFSGRSFSRCFCCLDYVSDYFPIYLCLFVCIKHTSCVYIRYENKWIFIYFIKFFKSSD